MSDTIPHITFSNDDTFQQLTSEEKLNPTIIAHISRCNTYIVIVAWYIEEREFVHTVIYPFQTMSPKPSGNPSKRFTALPGACLKGTESNQTAVCVLVRIHTQVVILLIRSLFYQFGRYSTNSVVILLIKVVILPIYLLFY